MADEVKPGLLNLEKELTCSICTEILFQPLTLLDCLHTFCGSCLKEWFTWQAVQAPSGTANPYTCPSCRASVRETRPNATVTTLLDMFIQANPGSGKTAKEKEEMLKRYKPGDSVMPKVENGDVDVDEEDRRMVEEIREMSLREVGIRGPRTYERGVRHGHRTRDPRDEDGRHRRRRDQEDAVAGRSSDATSRRAQIRQVEHQSSLRSLLSSSDVSPTEMKEEILRQIMEEGLLDGIDLDNMDMTQEDELSERIADALRRRHGQRSTTTRESQSDNTRDVRDARDVNTRRSRPAEPRSRRQHTRSISTADQDSHSTHPPISRPHLLEAYPTGHGHRRRTSSETRSQTSPTSEPINARQEAARSATDLSNRPRASERRLSDLSSQGRRATDPRPRPLNEGIRNSDIPAPLSPRHPQVRSSPARSQAQPVLAPQVRTPTQIDTPANGVSTQSLNPITSQVSTQIIDQIPNQVMNGAIDPSTVISPFPLTVVPDRQQQPDRLEVLSPSAAGPSSSSSSSARTANPILFVEPSINCQRCEKTDIQYDLHMNCSVCLGGDYNICHRCYRSGRGCLHWFGFGRSAWTKFQQRATADQSLPHILAGHRYKRPNPETLQCPTGEERRLMTTEDPSKRLQSGAFCANCSACANECFWKCEFCNDGEWGFCNRCVNTGKCCTHPLLPLENVLSTKPRDSNLDKDHHPQIPSSPLASPRMLQAFPSSNMASLGQYRPRPVFTQCDICRWPVQPSETRFHCYECNDGDYDICSTCYSKLAANGRISRENGEKGWRRCLRGHRMIVAGFEDSNAGQRRVIVKDLVGGHALQDESGGVMGGKQEWSWRDGQQRQTRTVSKQVSSGMDGVTVSNVQLQKYPPDGGVGLIVLANWAYLPGEGATDELGFPKGAEIREVEDINGDWFWGFYGGAHPAKGLFPASYVTIIDIVTM